VRAICERHGLPYNAGPLGRQFGSVVRKIAWLSRSPAARACQIETEPDGECSDLRLLMYTAERSTTDASMVGSRTQVD
jgi:hypothetical protein